MLRHASLSMILELWRLLVPRRRHQFGLLLGLMLVASFAEVVSIGAVLPFLAVLMDPVHAYNNQYVHPFAEFFGITTPEELLLPFTVTFCAAALASGGVRMLLLFATTRYTSALGADFSIDAYLKTLYQPYIVHVRRNSSDVINGIIGKTGMMVGSVLVPAMNLASSIILLLGVAVALLSVSPVIALSAGGGFGGLYILIAQVVRNRLRHNSKIIAADSTQLIKSLQEGLGGIRDVLISGTQSVYAELYRAADRRQRRAQGSNAFLGGAPRFIIETIGMVIIAIAAYAISGHDGGVTAALPILGALALGAQRLLPILQQAYLALVTIRGGEQSLQDALELLRQPMPAHLAPTSVSAMSFKRDFKLCGLGFRYDIALPQVLDRIDLVVNKGQRVGFIGPTGCGKSTLLDIIMGLLPPTEGHIEVDGVIVEAANVSTWQRRIAHVPQAIYLADCSVAENIAFGVSPDDVDPERVRNAARQAQIAETIEALPRGYETCVGERGIRLSGGQRQRVGIARALYKQADVIVFDEATSALDQDTEQAVMDAIDCLGRDLTILIVAHRLSTLRNCDFIVQLGRRRILRTGTYREVVTSLQ